MAVVGSSYAPLLLLDAQQVIIAASTSFCDAFEIDAATIEGKSLSQIGAGEWASPKVAALLKATISGIAEVEAYEMDLKRDGERTRRLVLHARKLDYDDADNIRLLLTISDVTQAQIDDRLKDDLLREKTILLQEVQHRVANSLQIIASVLLQNARKVQSEESRNQLTDAHQRVMSIAALQRQLAASTLGDVALKPYFTQLCDSLAASMIPDQSLLSLVVDADDSVTTAEASVSLGLIVTELVINALKHAFPGRRKGQVTVSYRSVGEAWTLSVGDNGVGMPKSPAASKPGLGSKIVEALAGQLDARIDIARQTPGAIVSVIHGRPGALGGGLAARRIGATV